MPDTVDDGCIRQPNERELVTTLKRQLALALKSNERMRAELAELRPYYRQKLRVAHTGRCKERSRAELWKHRAMNR